MGAPAKFMFNADFAQKPGERSLTPAEIAARIAEAEAAAYRKGFAAAEAETAAETARRQASALEHIAAAIDALAGTLVAVEARLEAEAVEVAVAVARKLAGELVSREPLAEITALATECFRQLVAAPHVVVRVNDTLHEFARDRIQEIAQQRGFEGRLVVLAEPDVAPGDCRIEWADGGRVRERAAIEATISELVARYLAARNTSSADVRVNNG